VYLRKEARPKVILHAGEMGRAACGQKVRSPPPDCRRMVIRRRYGVKGRMRRSGSVGPLLAVPAHCWSQIRAAATSAPIPADSVGSITGANMGEWFDGRSLDRAATSPIVVAPSKPAGSAPPSSQYTQGAPAAVASMPTSSLPVTRPGSRIICDTDRKAGRSGAGSLVVNNSGKGGGQFHVWGYRSSAGGRLPAGVPRDGGEHPVAYVGAEGPDAKPSSAWSGMMFVAVPACRVPMVTTAVSPAGIARETMACTRSTVSAAITTGSTQASGREACPPRSCNLVIAILAFAMGIQNALIRRWGIPDLATNVMTKTLAYLLADSTLGGGNNPRAVRRGVSIVIFATGATVGAFMTRYGVLWPILTSFTLFALALPILLQPPGK